MTIQLGYDSKNITLLVGSDGLKPNYVQEADQNKSGSGKIETIVHHHLQEIDLDTYFAVATYLDMVGWWSWVLRGNVFSLAMNSAKVGNTTLDGAANAGQKVVPLTATAALATGDTCLIRSADRLTFELVEIDAIDSGVSITAKANLKFGYASGDTFRHYDYYPSLTCTDTKFDPQKNGAFYRMSIKAVENV